MFEKNKISELDPESLDLTKTFVQSLLDTCTGAQPGSTGDEAATLAEMAHACRGMLQEINFDLGRRSIAQQAAAAARQRGPQFAQATTQLEALLNDPSRRSIGQQAAAAARQREPQFIQGVRQLETLQASSHTYDAAERAPQVWRRA